MPPQVSTAFAARVAFKLLPLFLVAYAIGSGDGAHAILAPSFTAAPTELVTASATLRVDLTDASLVLLRPDGSGATRFEISVVSNGVVRALSFADARTVRKGADLDIEIAPSPEAPAMILKLSVDAKNEAFRVELRAPAHVGLRFDVSHPESVFVPGTGVLSDLGTVSGKAVVLDEAQVPFAIASPAPLFATMSGDGEHLHLAVTTADADPGDPGVADVRVGPVEARIVTGKTSADLFSHAFASSELVKPVKLVVTGAKEEARVFGLDDDGHPILRMRAQPDQHITVMVPPRITSYYAAMDASDTSSPIRFEAGLPWDLALDVSLGGELHIRVVDADTDLPITARIAVRGIDGTLDPSFGPDYRASGAGPIMDALKGEVTTPVPKGRYRVLATKGIEYNVDAETVELDSGRSKTVELALRRMVDTPNMIACDLHVHARPSFDSPVSQEDRVLSLVSAGIEFAVPTEHNIVGDYAPSIATLDVGRDFAFVPGVEVTTYNPRFGHFGVFPYPLGLPPPYKGTTAGAVFDAAHTDPKRVLVVHHPRLPKQIGYFDVEGFDPDNPQTLGRIRLDFDALEVFNGYEKDSLEKVDRVLRDYYALLNTGKRFAATGSSDSHRIQYQWAGYPRTMVLVDPERGGTPGKKIDPAAVVAGIKHAHAIVTSGPIVEIAIDGKGPGEEVAAAGRASVSAHVRVRAAPWIDVTQLDVVMQGQVVATIHIPSRPTVIGKEIGDDAELAAKVLRWEGNIPLTLKPGTKWVLAVARGARKLDDVLPFMPVEPIGITNPVWITGS